MVVYKQSMATNSLHEPYSIPDTNSVHIVSLSELSSSLKLSKV